MGIRVLVGAVLVAAVAACSLIVNSDAEQCSSQADCARFPSSVCQGGFCVSTALDGGDTSDAPGSSGEAGDVDSGCVPLTSTPAELANDTCTGADCVPFDDCARLGICDDAGGPALVVPPAGGVP